MPLLQEGNESGQAGRHAPRAQPIEIALINNMPDSALDATARQFRDVLDAAAGTTDVRMLLFAIPAVPRGAPARRAMEGRYLGIDELWNRRIDGVIVTGTEPRAANLRDEPYWGSFAKLADWAEENTASSVWSCLAAHAAVLHGDGIERDPLAEKRFGVFQFANTSGHAIVRDTAQHLCLPHSRWNDLNADALTGCGYRILTWSREAGVDMFAKQRSSLSIFFQGHPEYDTATLLREYRRDIGRFLRGERESYPAMPAGYVDAGAKALLGAFRERALVDRGEDLLAEFPMNAVEAGLSNGWRMSAIAIYRNWISHLSSARAARRTSAPRALRPWRRDAAISAFGSSPTGPAARPLPNPRTRTVKSHSA
jgi:homoserine O-succinyltransferase